MGQSRKANEGKKFQRIVFLGTCERERMDHTATRIINTLRKIATSLLSVPVNQSDYTFRERDKSVCMKKRKWKKENNNHGIPN